MGLVILEIRQELFKQGKTLTILIEDITAASGVDDSLLDALLEGFVELTQLSDLQMVTT